MTSPGTEILVYSEEPALLLQLLGKARVVADQVGWQVGVLVIGNESVDSAALGKAGADKVYQVNTGAAKNPEFCVAAQCQAIAAAQPALTLIGGTKFGMEVAPRTAERTDSGYATWVVDFSLTAPTEPLIVRTQLFAGIGQATYQYKPQTPVILTVAPNAFEPLEAGDRQAEVQTLEVELTQPRLKILEERPKQLGGKGLENADLVVDIGQGVETEDDLELVRSLTTLLGGEMGCTRPIASERDWLPDWLGLSGAKVSPELCLTVGVSGQIQHIVGIRDSRVIAAVNSDENAAIFTQADYGVVADLKEFVPVLMDRIKARGVKPAWVP